MMRETVFTCNRFLTRLTFTEMNEDTEDHLAHQHFSTHNASPTTNTAKSFGFGASPFATGQSPFAEPNPFQ